MNAQPGIAHFSVTPSLSVQHDAVAFTSNGNSTILVVRIVFTLFCLWLTFARGETAYSRKPREK